MADEVPERGLSGTRTMDDQQPGAVGPADATTPPKPSSTAEEEGEDGRQESAPPGAVATVWSSILTITYRRLEEGR
ncbi:hypothetical protein ACIF6K_01485 [Streptomyces sp. NPDC085942]|uniref:hypothetical protein n=1 Tax=Streptomyces sp. NPDC085942 TaxID=3365743 RepID=UPI0037CF6FDA